MHGRAPGKRSSRQHSGSSSDAALLMLDTDDQEKDSLRLSVDSDDLDDSWAAASSTGAKKKYSVVLCGVVWL